MFLFIRKEITWGDFLRDDMGPKRMNMFLKREIPRGPERYKI
jgi:hypothetical protein